jgi:hypothetical protein
MVSLSASREAQLARASRGGLTVSLASEFVRGRARAFGLLLAVACVTCTELGASARDATTNIDIGTNEIGAPPAEFAMPPSGDGKQGRWVVVKDATAIAGIAIEQAGVQTIKHRFPLAISKTASLKNAEIRLRLKADGAKSDQGGGLALRLRTPEHYYLVQLDAVRDRVLFSLVSRRRRRYCFRQLAYADRPGQGRRIRRVA